MDAQSCLKVSLLALIVLSMATSLPHMYCCLRTFVLVSLPSVASAVAVPKCLSFVISNIIVVFLVSESKLSHSGSQSLSTADGEDVAATVDMPHQRQEEEVPVPAEEVMMEAVAPMVTGESKQELQEQEANMIVQEEEEEEEEEQEEEQEEDTTLLQEAVLIDGGKEEAGGVGLTLEEEGRGLPPADELNRRVEDFIARFNMERQLEARMLVCCR